MSLRNKMHAHSLDAFCCRAVTMLIAPNELAQIVRETFRLFPCRVAVSDPGHLVNKKNELNLKTLQEPPWIPLWQCWEYEGGLLSEDACQSPPWWVCVQQNQQRASSSYSPFEIPCFGSVLGQLTTLLEGAF